MWSILSFLEEKRYRKLNYTLTQYIKGETLRCGMGNMAVAILQSIVVWLILVRISPNFIGYSTSFICQGQNTPGIWRTQRSMIPISEQSTLFSQVTVTEIKIGETWRLSKERTQGWNTEQHSGILAKCPRIPTRGEVWLVAESAPNCKNKPDPEKEHWQNKYRRCSSPGHVSQNSRPGTSSPDARPPPQCDSKVVTWRQHFPIPFKSLKESFQVKPIIFNSSKWIQYKTWRLENSHRILQ